MKPTVECKGGVLLLHGQAFTSKNWEDIKTLHYIAAMGYTPIAVDLPSKYMYLYMDSYVVDQEILKRGLQDIICSFLPTVWMKLPNFQKCFTYSVGYDQLWHKILYFTV